MKKKDVHDKIKDMENSCYSAGCSPGHYETDDDYVKLKDNVNELIPLPPGFTAKKEPCIGVRYTYQNGNYMRFFYHPKDTNSYRKFLWDWYKRDKKSD